MLARKVKKMDSIANQSLRETLYIILGSTADNRVSNKLMRGRKEVSFSLSHDPKTAQCTSNICYVFQLEARAIDSCGCCGTDWTSPFLVFGVTQPICLGRPPLRRTITQTFRATTRM